METDGQLLPAVFGRWLATCVIALWLPVSRGFAQTEATPARPVPPAPRVTPPIAPEAVPSPTTPATPPIAPEAVAPPAPPASDKRVVVDKTIQKLFAYEGERLVLESRVSTGRTGWGTPKGEFTAGDKERMHYSRLFNNAPMPWSVQVHGHFFIHGFSYVPDYPASHGCIRMPTGGDNPAKRFYEWIEPGTPVTVTGDWVGRPRPEKQPKKK